MTPSWLRDQGLSKSSSLKQWLKQSWGAEVGPVRGRLAVDIGLKQRRKQTWRRPRRLKVLSSSANMLYSCWGRRKKTRRQRGADVAQPHWSSAQLFVSQGDGVGHIILNIAKEHRCMQRQRVQSNTYRDDRAFYPTPVLGLWSMMYVKIRRILWVAALVGWVFLFLRVGIPRQNRSARVDERRERYMRREGSDRSERRERCMIVNTLVQRELCECVCIIK